MKFYLPTILFLVANCFAEAQILDNTSGALFSEDPKFNTQFIRNNKIKSIKGYYSTKADYDRIRPTNNVYVYEFNQLGLLSKDYKTSRRDTIVRYYEYNDRDQLTIMRQSDQFGFHSHHYKYDSMDRMISKQYRRDVNKTGSKVNFKLDQSFIVSEEKLVYEKTSNHLKINYFNSLGKLYRFAFLYTDKNGYLFKKESQAINGNSRASITYTYNENGYLKEKVSEKILGDKVTTRIVFEYDMHNNILAQHYYRNGVYKTDFQIVYKSSNMLLSALLSRDIETNVITILKFADYTFYP